MRGRKTEVFVCLFVCLSFVHLVVMKKEWGGSRKIIMAVTGKVCCQFLKQKKCLKKTKNIRSDICDITTDKIS